MNESFVRKRQPSIKIKEIEEYLKKIEEEFKYLENNYFELNLSIYKLKEVDYPPISLESMIFLPLYKGTNVEKSVHNYSDLLAEYNKLVICGDTGSGKSTLLKRIALHLSKIGGGNSINLPVIIKLNRYNGSNKEKLIKLSLNDYDLDISEEYVVKLLEDYNLVFLVDGLEDIPVDYKVNAYKILKELIGMKEKSKCYITSRTPCYKGDFNADIAIIEPLNKEKIIDILDHYFEYKGNNVYDQLEEPVKELINNPLRLGMFVRLLKMDEGIPNKKTYLYQKFIEVLFIWDSIKNKHLEEPLLGSDEKELILTEYAYRVHKKGQMYFSKNNALILMSKILDESFGVKKEVGKIFREFQMNGIITVKSGYVEFFHPSYQEFFTAKKIMDLPKIWGELVYDERWLEVFKFVTDLIKHDKLQDLIDILIDSLDRSDIPLILNYNLTSLPTPPEIILKDIGHLIVHKLFMKLNKKNLKPAIGLKIMLILRNIKGENINNHLLLFIKNKDLNLFLRVGAVLALNYINNEIFVSLLDFIKNSREDHLVQIAIILKLLEIKKKTVINELLKNIKDKQFKNNSLLILREVLNPDEFFRIISKLDCSRDDFLLKVKLYKFEKGRKILLELIKDTLNDLLEQVESQNKEELESIFNSIFMDKKGFRYLTFFGKNLSKVPRELRGDMIDKIKEFILLVYKSDFKYYLGLKSFEAINPAVITTIDFERILDIPNAISLMKIKEADIILPIYKETADFIGREGRNIAVKMAYWDLMRKWTFPHDIHEYVNKNREKLSLQKKSIDVEEIVYKFRIIMSKIWALIDANRSFTDNLFIRELAENLGFCIKGSIFEQLVSNANSIGRIIFAKKHYIFDKLRNPKDYSECRLIFLNLVLNLYKKISQQEQNSNILIKKVSDYIYNRIINGTCQILEKLNKRSEIKVYLENMNDDLDNLVKLSYKEAIDYSNTL